MGNFVINSTIGPEMGSSAEFTKLESLKKSNSESIERRCSMLGSKHINEDRYMHTFELKSGQPAMLDARFSRFSIKLPYVIDTTGAAVHSNSKMAVRGALVELLEKNALYLFWYGMIGNRVNEDYYNDNYYYKLFLQSRWNVFVFVSTYFDPLKVCIVLIYKESELFVCGLGSNTILSEAIKHAFKESYLIASMSKIWVLSGHSLENSFQVSNKRKEHLDKLLSLPAISQVNNSAFTTAAILKGVPRFISEIHCISIVQKLVRPLKCARVFSFDLYNCLPQKKNLNLDIPINKETIQLTETELNDLPDCPVS